MRAAVFDGPGQFHTRDVPAPACPPGGLLLGVAACAVCGTDLRIVAHGHHKVAPPQILGHEVVGTVLASDCAVAVGTRATIAPAIGCGDCRWCRAGRPNRCPQLRTIGYYYPGAFAPLLPVPAEAVRQGSVCEAPADLADEVACLAEPLACCLNGQELVEVGPGDRVVIVGLGPIGCLHARLAAARGAAQVLLLERRPARRELAQRMGLGTVLNPPDGAEGEVVREATGDGADVVILAAPSREAQAAALGWLATGGRLSYFGGLPPAAEPVAVDSNQVHYRELRIAGAHGSTPAQNRAALDLLASRRVRADDLVTDRFGLEHAPEAVATMARGDGLKALVRIEGEREQA